MDEDAVRQNTEVPGQVIDTGPLPIDVLQARMTLLERETLDRMEQVREDLARAAAQSSPGRLMQWVEALVRLEARLDALRTLTNQDRLL